MRAILVCEENRAAIVEDSTPMWEAEKALEAKQDSDLIYASIETEQGITNLSHAPKFTAGLDPEMLVTIHGGSNDMYYIHGEAGEDDSPTDFYHYVSAEDLMKHYLWDIVEDPNSWIPVRRKPL